MKKSKLVLGRAENIVGKGENAGYQHFFPFPTMFSKAFSFRVVKSQDCVVKDYQHFLLFPQCFQKPCHSGLLKVEIVW